MACPLSLACPARTTPSDSVPGPVARPVLPHLRFVPEQTSCRNPVDQRIQDPDITHASPASRINKKRGVLLRLHPIRAHPKKVLGPCDKKNLNFSTQKK